MSNQIPSTHRKREQPWDQVLLAIIQQHGADILKQIIQTKVSSSSAPQVTFTPAEVLERLSHLSRQIRATPPQDTSLKLLAGIRVAAGRTLSQARERLDVWKTDWHRLRYGPGRHEPLQKAALEALCLAGFFSGTLFGLQLPQLDLKLSARGKERDSLILHAAALMASEVAVEWLQEILRRTLLTPTLGAGEARFLRATSRVLQAGIQGVERGWSARQVLALWIRFWRSPVVKQHHVATDARSLHIAQELIERLRK